MLVRPDGYVGARFRVFPKILKALCMKPFTRSFLSEAGHSKSPRKSLFLIEERIEDDDESRTPMTALEPRF